MLSWSDFLFVWENICSSGKHFNLKVEDAEIKGYGPCPFFWIRLKDHRSSFHGNLWHMRPIMGP